MKVVLFQSPERIALALMFTATLLINGSLLPPVLARPVDLDTFCPEFPLNSRCQGYKSPQEQQQEAAAQAPQVLKLRLNTSSSHDEWILISKSGDAVKLLHTTRKVSTFSRIFRAALGFSPVRAPVPDFHDWHDHQTTRVVFQPDSCLGNSTSAPGQASTVPESSGGSAPSQPRASTASVPSGMVPKLSNSQGCAIVGTGSVTLPPGTDIRRGLFTIDYTERQLLRAITFRIPANTKLASGKHQQNDMANVEK